VTEAPHASHRRLAWTAWATICVVWGTTYLAIKIALDTIPPFLMGGLRYVLAGALLAGLLAARGHRLPPRSEWKTLAVLGFCMIFMGNGGVVWGLRYLPSGIASVLIATNPFWMTSVDAMMRDGKQLFARQWVGLLVGFCGIVLLLWPDITAGGAYGRGFAIGVVSLQLACAGWAIGSAYTRRHVLRSDILGSAAAQMIFGGMFMLLVGTALGEWGRLSFNVTTGFSFAYLVIVGSIVGFGAYSYALQHLEVAIVSLYTYVNPAIAVALGTLALGEPFDLRMLGAIAVIVLGVLIVGQPGRSR